jgi:putative ubiquitin-RnfH superfamily antitoxin RatB of RatAB toxin-antitoxin module
MQEVEKAVKLAFQELYKNGKFKEEVEGPSVSTSIKQSNLSKLQSNNSLSNSSDMTIQSVELKSNKKLKNDSDQIECVESAMIDSLPKISKKYS